MLLELRIRDFAVIHDARLEARPGLNVLTGETGAGKSIVLGALSLLLGSRASSDSVRVGAERAVVEGVFDISSAPGVLAHLDELGFAPEDDLLVLRREVQAEGRNRAWVNGSPATASTVGSLGEMLVDLHGQHDHRTLLRPDEQRSVLDAFAGAEPAAERVASLHENYATAVAEVEELEARRRALEAQADFLRFQAEEIRAARLEPDEEETNLEESRRLAHAQQLAGGAARLADQLYEGDQAVAGVLAELAALATRLAEHDSRLEGPAAELDSVLRQVEELGRALSSYSEGVELDPSRLEVLRARQDLIFRLKRKYGPELADVIATGERLNADLRALDQGEELLAEARARSARLRGELEGAAESLSRIREDAALRLAAEVCEALPGLGLEGARFEVVLARLDAVGASGAESVAFHASLNEGFTLGPLSRIASGGEVSRIVLALEATLARIHRVPTLVFDEIDQGIGGRVAGRVAERLRSVAAHHQVFVVTHLAQIASRADHHLRVEKGSESGLAATRVDVLEGADRVEEIARMLGGSAESERSLEHAREMIGQV